MKETTAFALVKKLKALGHKVVIEDQPNMCKQAIAPDTYYAAILGDNSIAPADVNNCLAVIRGAMLEDHAPYTFETSANKKRQFPDSSFVAW